MNKRAFTKRILAVALGIIMVLCLVPLTAFAYPGDGGIILTSNDPGQYDMDGRPLLVYVTPNGGYVSRTSGGNSDSTQQFTATAYDGWFFSGWRTYYKGPSSDESNPNHYWDSEWCFSKPGDSESKPDLTSATIQVNKEWDDKGTYYLYAIFNPIITVRVDDGVYNYTFDRFSKNGNGGYSQNYAGGGYVSEQFTNMEYGYGMQLYVSLKYTHVPVRVSVNGVDKTFERDNGWILFPTDATESDADMLWLTGPVTIEVTTRLINCIVQFDANGGSGAMTAQTFFYGETQNLTENSFSKIGYTFAGWNTKADGTGTAYANKQPMFFIPVNDGEIITLYAQWTACTNHQWEDGKCTECGAVCSHFGGTATCTEQATCSECEMKYGDLGKHKHVYTASENIITETCDNNCGHKETVTITAPAGELVYDGTEKNAAVSYSDGWQGGELTVTYSDGGNVNAGKVTANITIDGVKASVDYTVDKINPKYTVPTGLTATYGQTLANIVLPEGWSWDDPTASVGDTGTNSFKAIFIPADTTNYNTVITDVDVTVEKAVITITVDNKTAKQYECLPQFTFTVTGLIQDETLITDPTINTQADMKSAGTFEIIAAGADAGNNYTITYVPGTLTVEAHTEHSGGVATCTEKAICTLCHQPYGETLTHTYGTDWEHDGTNHWHECTCGAKADVAVHSGGTATCTAKAVCTVCGSSYGEVDANAHNWGGWVSNGDGTHTRTCKTNSSHTETDNCTGGMATCTEKAICTLCHQPYGETLPHTYSTDWKHDGTNHWHECYCGTKAEVAAHNGDTATCENKAVCTACDQSYGELAAHTYENGKCTVCKAVEPNYIPEASAPHTGDNGHVALWVAFLFISGGALLALTVYNRKRRTYLR